MSQQGFFSRLMNLIRGMFGDWMGKKEEANPEAVYESAIQERIEQYDQLKNAVAGIVFLRNKLANELEQKSKDLRLISDQIGVAVDKGEDEVALVLIEKKDDLETEIARIKEELGQTTAEAEEAKRSLIEFQGEIERLRREKDRTVARMATLEARRGIMRQLDRLSPEADMRALEKVRDRVDRLAAEIEAGKEMQDRTLSEKLKTIRRESSLSQAKAQLEEMKKARQGRQEAAGTKVEKTI